MSYSMRMVQVQGWCKSVSGRFDCFVAACTVPAPPRHTQVESLTAQVAELEGSIEEATQQSSLAAQQLQQVRGLGELRPAPPHTLLWPLCCSCPARPPRALCSFESSCKCSCKCSFKHSFICCFTMQLQLLL